MNIKKLAPMILAVLAAGSVAVHAQTDSNAPAIKPPVATTNAAAAILSTGTTLIATNAAETADISDAPPMGTTNAVRMNFHDAPLSVVLNYLSSRMGFVVVSTTTVSGTATIVSEQPVGTNEVVDLLSGALAKNNYNVSRNGRVLTITTADSAKGQTPVHQADSPDKIPINDEMATYVMPVHTLNPTQLIKDLEPLIPSGATVVANEAGNAVVMTARQRDIHRFAEIIAALDGSSVSEVEVFILHYADAKSVAAELKEVFQSPDSSAVRSDARSSRYRGFGSLFGGSPGGEPSGSSGEQKNAADKAIFTSDDQMNAVVASAPPDFFRMITNVIHELDQPSQDVTMMKVFFLKYADPQETADELSNLFPDETKNNTDQNARTAGYRFTPPWMQPQAPVSSKSDRLSRQTSVRAVPDPRTQSVIVTTSKDLMEQIAGIIEALDKNPAGVQHERFFDLNNADPNDVQAALAALFSGPNSHTPTSSTSSSALSSRQQNNNQQQSQSTGGLGTTGTGSSALH